jgi:hypothetical protein
MFIAFSNISLLPSNSENPENEKALNRGLFKTCNVVADDKLLGGLDDVRTYGYKAKRTTALIYAHFRKELDVRAEW